MTELPGHPHAQLAPGAPGIAPTWCSSAKQMVGCALGPSRLWFTIGGGIVNEVYYPRIDIPQIRDLGFIVADDRGFWVEVKRLDQHELTTPGPGIPAVQMVHHHERFTLTLRVVPDPRRDVLLVQIKLEGDPDLRPYALLAPHLGGTGHDNHAAVAPYRGRRVLWAEQGPFGLALAAMDGHQRDCWGQCSAGYVGISDGWQDFSRNGALRWQYASAGPGNVALVGGLPQQSTLALGFGSSKESAATLAIAGLLQPFEALWDRHHLDWKRWHALNEQRCSLPPDLPKELHRLFLTSAMVLRTHQDKTYPGAMVASLSIPWGNTGDERGGYHLVWPRDLVECAGALLALGAVDDARDVLRYLMATQIQDGHWYQNQWLGGKPFWHGIQLDEAAFPVLLAATLADGDALDGIEVDSMVQRALSFILRNGPASDQDRWEEDAGINTFTLAVCIAALVAGAPFLPPPARDLALAVADFWNSRAEEWTTVTDTPLARRLGVTRYYVREGFLPDGDGKKDAMHRALPIKNRRHDPGLPASEQVGVDFLQLVRSGLRLPDDPIIRDTLTVVDALLKADTPSGVSWHRYNGDGYGEHSDGRPFDGAGHGRAWPLLTGERGHYQLAAGQDPLPELEAMVRMAGVGSMLPEQVWDGPALARRGLYPGRPSGSAMPLAWTHAEFIKLVISRCQGAPFDRPERVWQRYQGKVPAAHQAVWLEQAPLATIAPGQELLVCLGEPATVHWGVNGWQNVQDTVTGESGLGLFSATLPTAQLPGGATVVFTFRSQRDRRWRGRDFRISVRSAQPSEREGSGRQG
ncbi:MAG: glycoside hydrolase family 15 protein [Gammaproteobacteria bacterium]